MGLFDYLDAINPGLGGIVEVGLMIVYILIFGQFGFFESLLGEFNIFIRVTVRLTLLVPPTSAIYLFFNGVKRFWETLTLDHWLFELPWLSPSAWSFEDVFFSVFGLIVASISFLVVAVLILIPTFLLCLGLASEVIKPSSNLYKYLPFRNILE